MHCSLLEALISPKIHQLFVKVHSFQEVLQPSFSCFDGWHLIYGFFLVLTFVTIIWNNYCLGWLSLKPYSNSTFIWTYWITPRYSAHTLVKIFLGVAADILHIVVCLCVCLWMLGNHFLSKITVSVVQPKFRGEMTEVGVLCNAKWYCPWFIAYWVAQVAGSVSLPWKVL